MSSVPTFVDTPPLSQTSSWASKPLLAFAPAPSTVQTADRALRLHEALIALGLDRPWHSIDLHALPFAPGDITVGSESELQTAVIGSADKVDLPRRILDSDYFANIAERAQRAESSPRPATRLQRFVEENPEQVWENAWVRLPWASLNPRACQLWSQDMLRDREDPSKGPRSDRARFHSLDEHGALWLRVPISYLLKLALAQLAGDYAPRSAHRAETAERLMAHFLNDNSSPETFSFHVSEPVGRDGSVGEAVAVETGKRFLLTQWLLAYAEQAFALAAHGQRPLAYYSPHAPVRLHDLNDSVSDSFFRELFLSPCLSGWRHGEEKHRYMALCHTVLSRSQLNGLQVLREAGVIVNNLVVIPRTSNLSLANNGTHISLGSRRLSALLDAGSPVFRPAHEKVFGDLVIKVVEHFLPLFVGLYSAAPFRLDYADFHPERVLGFLPHELHGAHLRMLWRNWKAKARLNLIPGTSLTPMGPQWLDRTIATVLRKRGDRVPDYRLIDYLVALASTDRSPALDGTPGNQQSLLNDLDDLGVFDRGMSLYLPFKQREHAKMGFSGFEARWFSLFPSLDRDLAKAVDLQVLLTALAVKLISQGLTHEDIPDTRFCESERRQFLFVAAAGLRCGYVQRNTDRPQNRFLDRLLEDTRRTRPSRLYRHYAKVYLDDYRTGLLRFIEHEAADLIAAFDMQGVIDDLHQRLTHSADSALDREICAGLGIHNPLRATGREYNAQAERLYRETFRERHRDEAIRHLADEIGDADPDAQTLLRNPDPASLPERIGLLLDSLARDAIRNRSTSA
ncbi:MAG: hypothetical protein H6981_02090 [Gammaproteobacteria bacterium]|nr:hypothetical protein [Gammaproteobacteria bacterium]MCP5135580.1 hypothetical protein [Gammaproteobacteria bacterium]